jgi:2-polyprenyl-3-methyl-5-hydroxy-6-metoxy-1,4-benzoquinol methylase
MLEKIRSFLSRKKEPLQETNINPEKIRGLKLFILLNVSKTYMEFSGIEKIPDEVNKKFFNNAEDLIISVQNEHPELILTISQSIVGTNSQNEFVLGNLAKKIRQADPKAIIIGMDFARVPATYMHAGFDYFIFTGTADMAKYFFLNETFIKMIRKEKLNKIEKELVYEKEDFYDYVAKNHLFDKRSKITANTRKELRFLANAVKGKILDAGCGNGRLTIPLAAEGHDITGIDISQQLLTSAQRKNNGNNKALFRKENLLHTSFETESFDTIIMMWHVLCEFREYIPELLKEMTRILKKGGQIIFDVPLLSTHIEIKDHGVYQDETDSLKKYVGLVPDLELILGFLNALGFDHIYYEKVKWGANKIVFRARKYTNYDTITGIKSGF